MIKEYHLTAPSSSRDEELQLFEAPGREVAPEVLWQAAQGREHFGE